MFDFEPSDHVELGARNGWLDGDTAAKLSGARFTVLRGQLARLHRALAQFMLDLHTGEHGYLETNVPLLVNADSMRGSGQMTKFEEDLSRPRTARARLPQALLIPTSEVPLTISFRGGRASKAPPPLRMTAPFDGLRAEAGSHGRDNRGMIRQARSSKSKMVSIARHDDQRTPSTNA